MVLFAGETGEFLLTEHIKRIIYDNFGKLPTPIEWEYSSAVRPFLLSDRIPKIRKRSQDSTCPTRTTKTDSDYDGSSSRSSVGVLPRDAKFFVYSECPFQGTQYPPQDRVWTTESHLRTVKLVLEHTNCFAYRMIAFKVRKGPCVQQPPRSPYVSSFVLRTTELMHTKIRLRYILIFR